MNRLLAVISLLCGLALIIGPSLAVAGDSVGLQDFNRDACYSKCPCGFTEMEQACADCKQQCDREFWKDFDKSFKNKKKED